jgi:hypothetical protein
LTEKKRLTPTSLCGRAGVAGAEIKQTVWKHRFSAAMEVSREFQGGQLVCESFINAVRLDNTLGQSKSGAQV